MIEILKEKPFYLQDSQISRVEQIIRSMSLEEKIGQLFFLITYSDDEEYLQILTDRYHVGGIMGRPLPAAQFCDFVKKAQTLSKIPVFISANVESGGDGLVLEGTNVGCSLQIAATGDIRYVEKQAYVCAKEASVLGANLAFAPIVDIDRNFRNPITNLRTYGSDPEFVEKAGTEFIRIMQSHGIAATAKHFPGDGVDERDQHLLTSVNSLSCEEWDATYGKIYQACIDAGTQAVMVGHIMQPAYTKRFNPQIQDEDIMPGSLSREIMQDLLRGQLGFNGLILTDASVMAGMTTAMKREFAVPKSVAAGADMFLFSRNLEEDFGYMLQGYDRGIITEERLHEALIRIIGTKMALGLLDDSRIPDKKTAAEVIGCKEHREIEAECAKRAVTLVKNRQSILPLDKNAIKRILLLPLVMNGENFFSGNDDAFTEKVKAAFEKEGFEVDVFEPGNAHEGEAVPFAEFESKYDLMVYASNYTTKSNQTTVRLEWAYPMGANCPHFIHSVPTIFISFANPYHLLDVPRVKTMINAYKFKPVMLECVMDCLMGREEFQGISPVDAFCGKWDTHL